MNIQVRDRRTRDYFSINNAIIDEYKSVGQFGLLVYIVLARHVDLTTETCFVSLDRIAKCARISRASACRGVKELESSRLLFVERNDRKTSTYTLLKVQPSVSNRNSEDGLVVSNRNATVSNRNATVSNTASNKTTEQDSTNKENQLVLVPLEEQVNPQRAVKLVFDYYIEEIGKTPIYSLTDERMKMGVRRFNEALAKLNGNRTEERAVELMKLAVDGLAMSDYHMARGRYKGGTKYNDWENIFRSQELFEKSLERHG